VIRIDSKTDPRNGLQIKHIQTGNDGDICNAYVTYELVHGSEPKICIDIGVDEGWWSLFVTEINSNVRVDSFEPNPISYKALQPYLNDQITLHNVAISDTSGTLLFSLEGGQTNSRSNGTVEVLCKPLSPYIGTKQVDLIKIDTEGHDLIILKSLYPLLGQINAIVFECTPYWYGATKDICIQETLNVLTHLKSHYNHMYILSRRGPPNLIELQTDEDIFRFILYSYNAHYQVDILVCNISIQTIPIKSYSATI